MKYESKAKGILILDVLEENKNSQQKTSKIRALEVALYDLQKSMRKCVANRNLSKLLQILKRNMPCRKIAIKGDAKKKEEIDQDANALDKGEMH